MLGDNAAFLQENGVKVKTKVSKFEKLDQKLLARQDLVLGGDICFWDELVEPLYQTIRNCMDAGSDAVAATTIVWAMAPCSSSLRTTLATVDDF